LPDPEDAFLQWPPQPSSSLSAASNGAGGSSSNGSGADPLNALLMANHSHNHGQHGHGHGHVQGTRSKSPRLHSSQLHASYHSGEAAQLHHHVHVHDDMCTSIPHHHLFHMPSPSGPGSAGPSTLGPAASHLQYQPFSFNPAPSSYGGGINHNSLPGASVDLHAQLLFGTEVSHSWSALGGPQPLFPPNSSTSASTTAAAGGAASAVHATADLDFLLQSLTSATSSPAPASPVTQQLSLGTNTRNSLLVANVQSRGPTPSSSSAPQSPSLLHLSPTSLHLAPAPAPAPAPTASTTSGAPCTATSHHHHHPGLPSAPPPLPPSLTGIAPITACAAGPHSHSSSASAAPCSGAACSGHVDDDADEAERCSHAECHASGTASPAAVTVSPLRVAAEPAEDVTGKSDVEATGSATAASASKKIDGRKIGQRGKPAIIGIEQKTPGQYIHGQGDNLFIDARREDGTITCISLRSSPNRCKADLIEALNWMPEEVMLANWRYFSVLLAKIDQSKPFRRLASPQLATTAKKLRHLNPVVNVPPTALVQPMMPPAGLVKGTGDATAAPQGNPQHGGNAVAAASEGEASANPQVNGVMRDQPAPPPTPSAPASGGGGGGSSIPRSYSTSLLPSPPLQSPAPPPTPAPASGAAPPESAPRADASDDASTASMARMLHIVSVQTRAIAELTMANRSLAAEVAGLRADVGLLARAVAQGFKAVGGGQVKASTNGA
ncbi:hypothetical protein BCR44DRAFT_40557, partial [Catenaria anguillulae PL171]